MKMLVGLLTPDKGEITAFNGSLIGRSETQWLPIKRIAMLFQGVPCLILTMLLRTSLFH